MVFTKLASKNESDETADMMKEIETAVTAISKKYNFLSVRI